MSVVFWNRVTLLIAGLMVFLATPAAAQPSHAPTQASVRGSSTSLDFPNTITFRATLEASTPITEVVLEYGVVQRTCGNVIALAYPPVKPAKQVQVEWTWDMRRSGSLPPGATIWYRWRVTDQQGQTSTTPQEQVVWLDRTHKWQTVEQGPLTVRWYAGDQRFARELLTSANQALVALGQSTGITSDAPITIYVYETFDDLRDAVLYEPGWTGGQAFSDHNLTIMGIAPDQLEWGKRVTAHELTHVLVGNRAFSCIGNIPTWLNEGIAVYGEGGPEEYSQQLLTSAIATNELLSVRSLSGPFSQDAAEADLSYVQSYSIVEYLVRSHGREKLLQLFDQLRVAVPLDTALRDIYGYGIDGLEDRWRADIKASPRANAGQEATPSPLPSPVPTLIPVSDVPVAPQAPTRIAAALTPSPATGPPSASPVDSAPIAPAQFPWVLLSLGLLLVGGLAAVFVVWALLKR